MIIQMDRSQIPSRKPFHNLYIQKLLDAINQGQKCVPQSSLGRPSTQTFKLIMIDLDLIYKKLAEAMLRKHSLTLIIYEAFYSFTKVQYFNDLTLFQETNEIPFLSIPVDGFYVNPNSN